MQLKWAFTQFRSRTDLVLHKVGEHGEGVGGIIVGILADMGIAAKCLHEVFIFSYLSFFALKYTMFLDPLLRNENLRFLVFGGVFRSYVAMPAFVSHRLVNIYRHP